VRLLRAVAGLRAVFREPGARLARSWLDGLVVKALAFVHLADGDKTHPRTTATTTMLQLVAAFASTGLRAPGREVPATVTILVFTLPPHSVVGAENFEVLLVVGFMGALLLVDALVAAAHFGRLGGTAAAAVGVGGTAAAVGVTAAAVGAAAAVGGTAAVIMYGGAIKRLGGGLHLLLGSRCSFLVILGSGLGSDGLLDHLENGVGVPDVLGRFEIREHIVRALG